MRRIIFELDTEELTAILSEKYNISKDCIEFPDDIKDSLIIRVDMTNAKSFRQIRTVAETAAPDNEFVSAKVRNAKDGLVTTVPYRELQAQAEQNYENYKQTETVGDVQKVENMIIEPKKVENTTEAEQKETENIVSETETSIDKSTVAEEVEKTTEKRGRRKFDTTHDEELEKIYEGITNEELVQWVKDGNSVGALVKKYGLNDLHKWRFYDRLHKLQKEDASIPRGKNKHRERVEETPTQDEQTEGRMGL